MAHANVELLRRLDDAFNHGDFETVLASFSDDCAIHIAGRSKLAGEYHGKEAMGRLMGQYMESLGSEPDMETHALLADDRHGVMLQRARATKGGEAITINSINVFHIDDGKITAMWSMDENPYEADPFYDM